MRIISGQARGRKLKTLEGLDTRPTLDRTREALFNILQQRVRDARVLDLFAGSGALALEALSRGAGSAVLCDQSPPPAVSSGKTSRWFAWRIVRACCAAKPLRHWKGLSENNST